MNSPFFKSIFTLLDLLDISGNTDLWPLNVEPREDIIKGGGSRTRTSGERTQLSFIQTKRPSLPSSRPQKLCTNQSAPPPAPYFVVVASAGKWAVALEV